MLFFIIYLFFVVILVQSFEQICNMVVYSNMPLYVYDISPYFDIGTETELYFLSHLVF